MTPKPRTKRFLGRTLHYDSNGDSWHTKPDGYPYVSIIEGDRTWSVCVWLPYATRSETAKTERAARAAMVRKLRRLRDELSELEF